MSDNLHSFLLSLERRVYDPDVRRSAELCAPLFAEEFVEYGGNGAVYEKAGIVKALVEGQPVEGRFVIEDFAVMELAEGVALATYGLKLLDKEEKVIRQSLRSTIYRLTEGAWQQVFHQATKVD